MFGQINTELLPIKGHYFFFNAATIPIVQFLSTIARQLGFTEVLVGTLYAVLPIFGLIVKPLFGGLADKYHMQKIIFIIFQTLIIVAFFPINFIPAIEHEPVGKFNLTCDGPTFMEICSSTKFSNKSMQVVDNDKSTVHCNISCKASTKAYEVLCHDWKSKYYCSLVNSNTTNVDKKFDFTALYNMSNNVKVNNCVNMKLNNVTMFDEYLYPNCVNLFRTSCTINCPGMKSMQALLKEIDINEQSQLSTYPFHLFLWASVFGWIGMAVVVSLADAICIDLLGNERKKEYGRQIMWGSIGSGIFSISTGYLVDLFSWGSENKNYSCIFYVMMIGMIFDIIVSSRLKNKNTQTNDEVSLLWELGSVAREGRVLVFIFWCIGAGMCTGVIWAFVFWHMDAVADSDQRDWLKTLQGLLTGIRSFMGELPFNFISGQILKKLGHINVMSLVLLMYAIRFMAYSLIKNIWFFAIVELLHGPTFGLSWPTMVAYGDKIAPSGTRATMQGLVGAVFEGIGVSSGSLICGYLMNTYGGELTFRIYSVGALTWLSIYWIFQLLLRKAKAYPLHQGHSHLASYATPNDAILMTMSQELQTY